MRRPFSVYTYMLCLLFFISCSDDKVYPKENPGNSSYNPEDLYFEEQLNDYLKGSYSCSINSVLVSQTSVTVSGTCPDASDNMFYVGEITPYEDLLLLNHCQFQKKITQNVFTLTFDRFVERNGVVYDRLLSKWAIFQKGNSNDLLVSKAHYADVIQEKQKMSPLRLANKKGLGGIFSNSYITDFHDLGIGSATLNIIVNHFFHLSPLPGDIPYEYGGKIYYVNVPYLEGSFDPVLREAAKYNIVVAAIILFSRAEDSTDPDFGMLMQHPNNNGGVYTMPNMTTPEAVHAYAAVMNFLAERYCRPDNLYGRIAHWIIHNEVDAGIQWANMGMKPVTVFTDAYVKSLRLCYHIVRQYDANSEVFASFTHSWSAPCVPEWNKAKDIISLLTDYSLAEGDFQWALAYHSYPVDLLNPRSWEDPHATFSMDTEFITFRNLEVLNRWALTPENMYKKRLKRSIWLSEAGINSRSYSENDLREQAAGFAYAWKKLNSLPGIDALQWHNWFDNEGDGSGALLGMRKFIDKNNGDPKPVWELYQAAGTLREDEAFDPLLKVIGIPDWNIIEPF